MSPEFTLLAVNAAFLAFAYLWVYPGVEDKRLGVFLRYDLAISAAALLVAGLLYGGQGFDFSLIVFDVPWWLFSILTFLVMEVPAWEWFRRRNGIDYDDL